MENLKEKTAKGLMWGAVNNGTMQILNLLIGIIILRHVTPADTGLIGMLAIFTAIAGNLQSSGFSTALINEKQPTPQQYNSVFWFNVLMGGLLYAVLFASAPLISWFFRQPRLTDLSRFLFLSFFISSFGISTHAYMVKNMMNREITIINLTALVVSGTTAIVMALNDMAYWSLAWQQVIYISVANIFKYYFTGWIPTLPVDFSPIRRMFSFSSKMLATNMLTVISQNVLTFIFGKLLPISTVGLFNQANKWNTMGSSLITNTMAQVAQPVLSNVNSEEERQERIFRKMLRFTSLLSFPLMFGLALTAHEFILLTVGPTWERCVPLLQILCVGGACLPLQGLYQNFIISRGRSDIYLRMVALQIFLQIGITLSLSSQGITTMVAAFSALNVLYIVCWHLALQRIHSLALFDVLKDTVPFALIAALVMLATHYITLSIDILWFLLLARVITAALLYFIVMRLLNVTILKECLQFIRKKH
jgi:O-antigen/teichoic acid export membrane protein